MNTPTNAQVIDRIVQSEAGRKAAADIQRDYTGERIALQSQASALRKERGKQTRELADKVAATQQHLEAARATLTLAEQAHRQATMEQAQNRAHYDARIKGLEGKLRTMAPAAIDTFIEWLGDEEQSCKETVITKHGKPTDKISTHTSEKIHEFWTNAASLRDRLAAIRAARTEAITLKSRVMDADDIQQRLDELRDGLPEVTMQYSHSK